MQLGKVIMFKGKYLYFNILHLLFADGSPETRLNVKFVQDTSKFWYKPDISREQGKVMYFCVLVELSVLSMFRYRHVTYLNNSAVLCGYIL